MSSFPKHKQAKTSTSPKTLLPKCYFNLTNKKSLNNGLAFWNSFFKTAFYETETSKKLTRLGPMTRPRSPAAFAMKKIVDIFSSAKIWSNHGKQSKFKKLASFINIKIVAN